MMALVKKGSDFRQSRLGKSLISFILLSLLTLIFSVSWQPIARSQLPSLPSNDRELINRPRQLSGQMGNLLYAPIKIDGRPILLVAVPSSAKAESTDKDHHSPIQDRVIRIENKLQEILKRGFDPATLQVFPSVLNGQTVILASDQKNFKPQNIGTITELDAELYGQGIDDIAPEATKMIRAALIRAWEERQPKSLQQQALLALQIMAGLVVISLIFMVLQNLALGRIKQLKQLLSELQADTDTPISSPNLQSFSKKPTLVDRIGDRIALLIYWFIYQDRANTQKKSPTQDSDSLPSPLKLADLIDNPKQFLNLDQVKLILTRKINVLVFLRRFLIFVPLFLWLRAMAFILTLFPYTRDNGILLAGAPASLLSIWIGILLTLKIAELLIDRSLHVWSDDFGLLRSKSNREQIRIPTISNAIKGVNFVCFISLGIILSLTVFDVPIATVLAGAGILGFAVSFGSQSLIKDLIAGVINLANDAYAVGDFVIIGNDDGLVENMNLFVTRIRSANGDLITISNGSVGTVRNQSKDWSRVDYKIQVSYETDIPKALEIMLAIAQQLYDDPQWNPLILAPPDLKGVEDISHQGVMIRIWLKTKPGEQWMVGRELRLRMKDAFEKAGITIGIPKQTFLWQNTSDSNDSGFPSLKENVKGDSD